MRILKAVLSLALVADVAIASSWLSRAGYNKWHQTELEQWLTDHDIPYPAKADRKELQSLVETNWNDYVVAPYNRWDTDKLSSYLQAKGVETKTAAEKNKDSLLSNMQKAWYESEDKAQSAYGSVKDWILDSWSDSQLKSFCDYHSIPVPQPRNRDLLLQKARQGYDDVAKKLNKTSAYPGNWLYETWSDSDLKEWLDTHGFPAPQPTTRDKLIASVRRNSRLAYLEAEDRSNQLKESASGGLQNIADSILDTWGASELKNFCDKNGIKVPQGSKVDEIRALIRHRRASVLGDTATDRAKAAFGAATTKAGNEYARATQAVSEAARAAFGETINTWSESRLKSFLDARGVPVPQRSTTEELRALVRKNAHLAASGWTAWTFDDFSYENLRDYLVATGDREATQIAEKAGATRDDLLQAAQAAYASASKAGGNHYASVTSYLSVATQAAKNTLFDTWSDSDIKAYLDTYGVPIPQGTTGNELRAFARRQATYFKYGTLSPSQTLYAKFSDGVWGSMEWAKAQVQLGAQYLTEKVQTVRKTINEEL